MRGWHGRVQGRLAGRTSARPGTTRRGRPLGAGLACQGVALLNTHLLLQSLGPTAWRPENVLSSLEGRRTGLWGEPPQELLTARAQMAPGFAPGFGPSSTEGVVTVSEGPCT